MSEHLDKYGNPPVNSDWQAGFWTGIAVTIISGIVLSAML